MGEAEEHERNRGIDRTVSLKVMYFASARDIVGKREELLSIGDAMNVGELAVRLQEIHPRLGGLGKSARYALNLEIVDGDTALHEGDEVAVLPAVTGG